MFNQTDASGIAVLHPDTATFEDTHEEFERYDDQRILFIDHMTGMLARERDADHVFALDEGDFRTFGFTVIPVGTGMIDDCTTN